MKKWQNEQMPRKWREKDARMTETEIGRVGEEWKTSAS